MQTAAFTGYFDVAQVTLYAFWVFFALLIFFLRREDRREGYPVVHEIPPRARPYTLRATPEPKTFLLEHGGKRTAPRIEAPIPVTNAESVGNGPGAALRPLGNPLLAGIGPGAWVNRADVPDLTYDDSIPKIVPLRVAHGFHLESRDPDPRGFKVIGADRKVAGTVTDVWVDRSEVLVRYIEIAVAGTEKKVLAPATMITVKGKAREVRVDSLLASQFADAPVTKSPDQITLREEDQVVAYYGAGTLWATPSRTEPLV